MSTPKETVWPLEPHSFGKHIVLRRYLKAWLPILGTTQGRIVFIDGFAGPGEYTGGEQGSPIIALEALGAH
jgi:three-Cys-motif partner protein